MTLVNPILLVLAKLIICMGIFCFFVILRRRILPQYHLRKKIGFSPFLRNGLLLAFITLGIFFMIRAMVVEFVRVDVLGDSLKLTYGWPRGDVMISTNELQKIEIQPVGKGNRAQIVIYSNHDVFQSAAVRKTFAEDVMNFLKVDSTGRIKPSSTSKH